MLIRRLFPRLSGVVLLAGLLFAGMLFAPQQPVRAESDGTWVWVKADFQSSPQYLVPVFIHEGTMTFTLGLNGDLSPTELGLTDLYYIHENGNTYSVRLTWREDETGYRASMYIPLSIRDLWFQGDTHVDWVTQNSLGGPWRKTTFETPEGPFYGITRDVDETSVQVLGFGQSAGGVYTMTAAVWPMDQYLPFTYTVEMLSTCSPTGLYTREMPIFDRRVLGDPIVGFDRLVESDVRIYGPNGVMHFELQTMVPDCDIPIPDPGDPTAVTLSGVHATGILGGCALRTLLSIVAILILAAADVVRRRQK